MFPVDAANVVVRGQFNPLAVTPFWLAAEKLIGRGELQETKVDVVTPQLAVYTMDWLRIQVTPDSLQLSTLNADEFERLRDAAVGILRANDDIKVLSMGINRDVHIELGNKEYMNRVGDLLAPKEAWSDVLLFPALTSYQVLAGRGSGYLGTRTIKVEPSNIVFGIFVSHNDHYSLETSGEAPTHRDQVAIAGAANISDASEERRILAQEVLTEDWQESMLRSKAVIDHVLALGGSN